MSIAGPSQASRSFSRESTYEQDLLELLDQLSIEDMNEIQAVFDRTSAGLSDHEIALNDLIQQARELEAFNRDRALAEWIANATDSDVDEADIREKGKRQEKKRRKQHEAIHQETPHVVLPRSGHERKDTKGKGKERPQTQTVEDGIPSSFWKTPRSEEFGSQTLYEPSPTSANPVVINIPKMNRPTGHDCVICLDPIYGAEIKAPCGHYYDINCVTDLFQSATRDETLFPPRCCKQNIPFTQVKPHLSRTLIATFKEKEVEFSTMRRVYCSSPTCSRFLGPQSADDFTQVYTCPASGCARQTCGKCRGQYSDDWSHVCRPDADATELLELSHTSGWARCPGCSQMIELNIGCFHMTCRCRTEFCYLCRAPWKTCPCRQWDEWRLFAAAEQRVNAQLGVDRERAAQPGPATEWRARLRERIPPAFVPRAPPQINPERLVIRPGPAIGLRPRLNQLPPPTFVPARHPYMTIDQQLENLAPTRPRRPLPAPPTAATRVRPPGALRTNRRPANAPTVNIASAELVPIIHPAVRLPASSGSDTQPADIAVTSGVLAPIESTSNTQPVVHLPTSRLSRLTEDVIPTTERLIPGGRESNTPPVVRPPTTTRSSKRLVNIAPSPEDLSLAGPGYWEIVQEAGTKPVVRLPGTRRRPADTAPTPSPMRVPVTAPTSGHAHLPKPAPPVDDTRERMIREMMERLREDHDCDHAQWRFRDGGGRCENCGTHLPLYLFRCQGCELLACNRCRRNRL